MATDTSEIAHLLELFELPVPLSARRMFGGWGVYAGGLMFAAVIDGELLLKTDEQTRERFGAAGCGPFMYRMRGREQPMSYWSVPAEALDSAEAMRP
ncbi:TfoX/Sxy family protein, partial [Marilutibacter maris]